MSNLELDKDVDVNVPLISRTLFSLRILFTQWNDFKAFQEANPTPEAIDAALERAHAAKRARELARQKRQQQQQVRENFEMSL